MDQTDDSNHNRYLNLRPKDIIPQICRYLHIRHEPEYMVELDTINSEIQSPINRGKRLKILFGPSFSIHPPCYIHDRILSYALRLRGAEIIPVYCDALQSVECNVCGGVWGGQSFFEHSCSNCVALSQRLWAHNPISPLKMSQYISMDERKWVHKCTTQIDRDSWLTYEQNGFPFGKWAKDILVNNYVVGDYHQVPNCKELGITHIENLLLLKIVYEKILEEIKPDRVISNDSYYGMWAMLQSLCEQKGIPFYSHWIGGRQHAWCYAFNDAAMNLNFSAPWKMFSQIPLNERQRNRVQTWLDMRPKGNDMILDTASARYGTEENELSKLDPDKPTALLPSNVIWDLAALNKQVVFKDMIEWIVETISWFKNHPEYQLIIKPHPGEKNPKIPETKETVAFALSNLHVIVPDNVILLSPNVDITVYQLFPLVKAGIVHTTTVGIEMAAQGLPVITTAKSPYRGFGFTIDPSNRSDYFRYLKDVLSGRDIICLQEQIDLAFKFISFYNFHYYTKIDIMDYRWGEIPKLKIKNSADLNQGKNICLDYIVDSIIDGKPIVSADRWPPES